jgi:hypothetical protein
MSAPLLFVVSLIYWSVAAEQLYKGSWPGFITWAAYGTANWGLMWTVK